MMTNSELLALLHKRFGIGSNNWPVNNDKVIAFCTVIQTDNDNAEEEDSGNNEDDSDCIDHKTKEQTHNSKEHELMENVESDGITETKPPGKSLPVWMMMIMIF